jgi:hypothetical protein
VPLLVWLTWLAWSGPDNSLGIWIAAAITVVWVLTILVCSCLGLRMPYDVLCGTVVVETRAQGGDAGKGAYNSAE